MVITWIGYCLLVSALLGLAAYASERALGHYRKPVRWGWFAAIAGAVTAPVVAFVAPGLFPGAAPPPMAPLAGLGEWAVAPSVPAVPDLITGAQAAGGLDVGAVSALLGWAWALLVLAMGFHLVRAYGRLRSEMRTWTPAEVQGSPVLLSANRGPAVVGVGCSVVVMPTWIAELEDRLLRLVSLHEREHQRAGDQPAVRGRDRRACADAVEPLPVVAGVPASAGDRVRLRPPSTGPGASLRGTMRTPSSPWEPASPRRSSPRPPLPSASRPWSGGCAA